MTLNLIFDQSNDKFNNDLKNFLKNKYFPVKLFETDIKGNRGSYLKCCDLAKNSKDLIFFCEDDYLFEKNFLMKFYFHLQRFRVCLNRIFSFVLQITPFFMIKIIKLF